MSFGDLRAAFDARNILTTIAEEVVNRLRPEEKIGKVYSYDKVTQTAQVLFAGETVNNLVTARFGLDKQPFISMDALWASQGYAAPGDIVRVAGKPGGYYILDFVAGYPKNWDGTEIGMGFLWFGNTLPSDQYLWCRGGTYSGAAYPVLASKLGDSFGTHSGDTYYLPNMNARVPVGVGGPSSTGSSGYNYALGQGYGSERVNLTEPQLPVVSGDLIAHSGQSNFWQPSGAFSTSQQVTAYAANPVAGSASSVSVIRYRFGNNESHENVQPVLGVNFVVRAK